MTQSEHPTISVVIVDDQALIRSALRSLIEVADDLQVVGEGADGREAIDLARRLRPDILLMDIRMPGLDGISATRQICADPDLRDSRVLILTTFEDDANVLNALRAGASGFLGKGMDTTALIDGIRTVHRGESLLSSHATRTLIEKYVSPGVVARGERPAALDMLTDREVDTMRLVARGKSNAEIAATLSLSVATAKTHVNRAMTKLDAHDRAQLVVIAYETGLVVPSADAEW